MDWETDFELDELGNSMEINEAENNNALGTFLMDNYVWQDDDISKSINVLGIALIDNLWGSLQEDGSNMHDASYTSATEDHTTFQEDNMTKKVNCFLNIQMENPPFAEMTKVCSILNVIPKKYV